MQGTTEERVGLIKLKAREPRRLLRRKEAAKIAGWSLPTLRRRELSDPTIPPRIGTGPAGGPPWAYWSDGWQRYLDALPAAAAVPQAMQEAAATARRKLAEKRAATPTTCQHGPREAPTVAEGHGAAPRGENRPAARKSPQRDPHGGAVAPMAKVETQAASGNTPTKRPQRSANVSVR